MASITIRHTREDGTVLDGSAKGDGVYEIVKGHGFRWSREVGIYVRGSRDKRATEWRINGAAEALRAAGHEVAVEIDDTEHRAFAEVEAGKAARVADRAEGLADAADRHVGKADGAETAYRRIADGIPLGQPILVGHHSEGRHRRDIARMRALDEKRFTEVRAARELTQKAEAAAGYRGRRENLPTTLRRLERLRTDQRDVARRIDGTSASVSGPATGDYLARMEQRAAELVEAIAYWEAHVEALKEAGAKVWGPADFTKGDHVKCGGQWFEVLRVNKKSLTVPTGYSWTQTLPYDKVTGRRAANEAASA